MKTREKVHFRLIVTPCCGTMLCYVNPRLPTYCSECGELILPKLKSGEHTMVNDENAWLILGESSP